VKLVEVEKQDYDVLVYLAPEFRSSKVQEIGIKGDSFTLYNTQKIKILTEDHELDEVVNVEFSFPFVEKTTQLVVIAGTDSTNVLRQSLAAAAAKNYLSNPKSGVVPLNADSTINANGETTLFFSPNNLFLKKSRAKNLFAAHNQLWGPSGLIPLWRGVTLPYVDTATLKRGDLVEKLPNGEERSTVSLNSQNVAKSPKHVVFLVEDAGNLPTLSKLSSQQAAQFLLAGYNGNSFDPFYGKSLLASADPKFVVDSFKGLIERNNVPVFVVNTNVKGKIFNTQELDNLLKALDTGASGAKGADKSEFSTLTPIVSLPGYSASLDSGNGSKYETALKGFLKNTFPSITL